MIAINGVPFNQVEKDNLFRKIYNEAVDLLKKTQDDYTLKFVPALMTKKDPLDPTSRDEFPTGITFKATQRYVCDEGECEFTYYTNSRQGRHGLVFIPERVDFSKIETISTKKDIDKAFFMIMVSTVCQNDPRFKKYQNNRKNPNSQYYIEDAMADAKAKLHYEQMVTRVRNLFFDPDRMISDIQIAKFCSVYGIEALDRSPEELRTLLAGNVMKMNKDLGYNLPELEKFYNLAVPEKPKTEGGAPADTVEVDEAKIQLALDQGIIRKEEVEGKKTWVLMHEDDSMETICVPINTKGKHEEQLLAAISSSQILYDKIIASIK